MDYSDKLSDTELYENYIKGDKDSYDQLMIRYGDSLTMYLHNYLNDWHMAEDLMIEAFARIMVKMPKIREDKFKAYLYKTGHNLALRYLKRKSSITMFSVDGLQPGVAEYILHTGAANRGSGPGNAGHGSPAEETLKKEKQQQIMACMDRIEPELKEALWLIYFEDMTYEQAAEVMGVKKKRIERLLVRGKEHMRKEMEKEGITNAYE